MTKLILELCYIDDESIKTQYVFNITRPYDYTAEIAGTSGITLVPVGRELYATKYNGFAEGTVFRNDENGNVTDTPPKITATVRAVKIRKHISALPPLEIKPVKYPSEASCPPFPIIYS